MRVTMKLAGFSPDYSDNLRDVFAAIAESFGLWREVEWINEPIWEPSETGIWPWPLQTIRERVRSKFGHRSPDQLWFPHLELLPYRLVLETYRRADVVLYEDGLNPYGLKETWSLTGRYVLRRWKHFLAFLLRGRLREHISALKLADWRLATAHVRRVSCYYTYLGSDLPVAYPFDKTLQRVIDSGVLLRAISSARCSVGSLGIRETIGESDRAKSEVIVLPQPLRNMAGGVLGKGDEIALYTVALRHVIEKGYRVLWKDHPRERDSLLQDIIHCFPSGRIKRCTFDNRVPIELASFGPSIAGCVGFTSSSLFYLQKIGRIPVYTFSHWVLSRVDEMVARKMGIPLTLSHVARIEELPPCSKAWSMDRSGS